MLGIKDKYWMKELKKKIPHICYLQEKYLKYKTKKCLKYKDKKEKIQKRIGILQ